MEHTIIFDFTTGKVTPVPRDSPELREIADRSRDVAMEAGGGTPPPRKDEEPQH